MVTVPPTLAADASTDFEDLQLVVVEGDAVTVHDLPRRGGMLIGRSHDADVQVADPSSSARHARLSTYDDSVVIEDLGSRNGTHVRGQRIAPSDRVQLSVGEAALVGGAVLVVQRKNRRSKQRRLFPHGYFELRLAEECELAAETAGGLAFSLARVDVDRAVSAEAFADAASEALRPSDILGTYGPNAYEILFRRTTVDAATSTLGHLVDKLTIGGAKPRAALAHYPSDGQTPHALLERACHNVRSSAPAGPSRSGVVVLDEQMREIYRLAEKAAPTVTNVLILGETGVGKEILAETIHRASKRADKPFLCLNCAAFTESLLESELFGHEKGAFTDAKNHKPGLFESAEGGTVFLDEIGEMSATLQAKLLRVIETKEVKRVGGLKTIPIDVRFLAATHRDLVAEVREKRFRSDLYYRLNVIRLEIPPLRERTSEIRSLSEVFVQASAKQAGLTRPPRLTEDAVALLESYAWPGNVRELRNVIERAVVLSDGGVIDADDLPLETISEASDLDPVVVADLGAHADDRTLSEADRAERTRVIEALRTEGGNQTRAAKRLGIARGTLIARIRRFHIRQPRAR
jgi:DNA-binding NtrC family response regulator